MGGRVEGWICVSIQQLRKHTTADSLADVIVTIPSSSKGQQTRSHHCLIWAAVQSLVLSKIYEHLHFFGHGPADLVAKYTHWILLTQLSLWFGLSTS